MVELGKREENINEVIGGGVLVWWLSVCLLVKVCWCWNEKWKGTACRKGTSTARMIPPNGQKEPGRRNRWTGKSWKEKEKEKLRNREIGE